ncbi:MAG: hypothetical protein B7X55_01085, partial [Rhodobacterales bacterium 34-62-10]
MCPITRHWSEIAARVIETQGIRSFPCPSNCPPPCWPSLPFRQPPPWHAITCKSPVHPPFCPTRRLSPKRSVRISTSRP